MGAYVKQALSVKQPPTVVGLFFCFLFCRAVWSVVCRRKATGASLSSAVVVGLAASWVTRAMRLDWLRVAASLPGAAALPSWCIVDERFRLTQGQFRDRWCINDVLAHTDTSAAGGVALHVHVPQAIP